jgi:nitrogen fixation-related uncharacterized protein
VAADLAVLLGVTLVLGLVSLRFFRWQSAV